LLKGKEVEDWLMGSGEIATADTREKPEPNFSALSCMH